MIPRRHRRTAAALLIALIGGWVPFLAGCDGPTSAHPAVGRTVGNLPLALLADPSRRPPTFAGRVTLLNFWGTWCPPCRRELPGLVRLADRLRNEPAFQLVAISCGGRAPEDMAALTESTNAFLKEAVSPAQRSAIEPWADPDGRTRMIFSASFGFEAFPTTYLIGPDAKVRQVWVGYRSRDESDIASAIVATLKEVAAVQPAAAAQPAAVAADR
jgi:cytochrome c biogenesis protein CcmG/thiol:disulfide interchange protein DsbE